MVSIIRSMAVVSISLWLLSCSYLPRSASPVQVELPPERSYHRGYSIVPLNEAGWIVGEDTPNGLILGRKGDLQGESYIIQAALTGLPELESPQAFLEYLDKNRDRDADPSRFNYLQREMEPYARKGEYCARYHAVTEDKAAVTRPGVVEDMVLEIVALICRHPDNSKVSVEVAYSHRHHPGMRDSQLLETADGLFASLHFEPL